MADKMMRIAGRTSGGTAAAVKTDSDGRIDTIKSWGISKLTLYSGALSDTTAITTTNTDVSEYPLVSLRITNRTGVPVTITPLTDIVTSSGWKLVDVDGSPLTIELAPTSNYIVITPTDAPWLNYIKNLRLSVQATATPSADTPTIEIYAMVRK